MTGRNRGFTLIEILVVITIIAGLMGMVVVLFGPGRIRRDITITKTRIGELTSAIEQLRSSQVLAMYPMADILRLKGPKGESVGTMAGKPNDTNIGIECIYVATHLSTLSVRLQTNEDWFGNTDGDQMGGNPTRSAKLDLYEFVDAWKNPLAYFSSADYREEKAAAVGKYIMQDGRTVEVHPWRNEKTGLAVNQGTYQLFSAGPDQEFNTKDDIGNWGN